MNTKKNAKRASYYFVIINIPIKMVLMAIRTCPANNKVFLPSLIAITDPTKVNNKLVAPTMKPPFFGVIGN
jgi:hypothetical protein